MIYLDNAATTEPKFFRKDYTSFWYNSNMPYATTERKHLAEAREKIKKVLGVKGGRVLFFRCSTEAIEWLSQRVDKIGCFDREHDSVWNVCEHDKNGCYLHFAQQYVNQMAGVVTTKENWENMSKILHDNGGFFFSDFTATIGHVAIPENLETVCDAVWFSGHKFHTEKNIGAMWISDKLAQYLGATVDQRNQYGLVHGTVDVAGAMMLADALEHAQDNIYGKMANYAMLRNYLMDKLQGHDIHGVWVTSHNHAYAINAICFDGINADALATYLESRGIYIGRGGSACSEDNDYRVLNSLGLTDEQASRTIRVSFCEDTTKEDIDWLVAEIVKFKEMF